MPNLDLLLACLIAYLLGSISSAVLVCKFMDFSDPRTQGSHNPGATNVLRIAGKKAAFLTLAGDILKGIIPVLAAKYYGFSAFHLSLVAASAFVGHLYPLFFRFRGGKGVATLLGVTFALAWPLGLALTVTWVGVAFTFGYSSLAALVMALCAPLYAWYLLGLPSAWVLGLMSLLLMLRHRVNILNLLAGTENKIGKR